MPFCESLCTYCGCNTRITKNHAVELPYIQAVIKEWDLYVALLGERPKIKELHLGGGTPTFFSPENLQLLLKHILRDVELATDSEFSFEAHPANTTIAHLQSLYELGFKRLSLGIQDFDPKVQFMINRFQTPAQVLAVVEKAREIGYTSINFDLIYGLPAQTLVGLAETMTEVITMKPDRIAFYSYAHVPWLKPGQRHYSDKDLPKGEEKFALYELGRDLLLDAGFKDIGMDHFALAGDALYQASLNKQLHRNFMGYTHQHTQLLIGLGVSSISDCWTAFAQNPKTVEAYLNKVNTGTLAVEKGHLLNDLDLKIRKHILEVMCQGITHFEDGISEAHHKRLSSLISDGIVEVDDNQVIVTHLGQSFLRNVCMAFDERFWAQQPTQQVFSETV
ncbi:Oxygen-independent coproporphyrinogen III oxidase [compost metagenome]